GSWFGSHVPSIPVQWSGLSQSVSPGSPQAVVAALKPVSWPRRAPSQESAFVHTPSASPHAVVAGSWFGSHVPSIPVQWSGLSQSVSAGSPHAVVAALMPLSWQSPAPSQESAFVHAPSASPHAVVAGSWFGSHVPSIPVQWSGLSQSVSAGSPQAVVAALKPLSWQSPAPSQESA